MIGGRVLGAAALVAFASRTSVYAEALVWTAVEEGLVLVVPASAVAGAWSRLTEQDHPALDVLLELPVTVDAPGHTFATFWPAAESWVDVERHYTVVPSGRTTVPYRTGPYDTT